jgi:hypothetical protein
MAAACRFEEDFPVIPRIAGTTLRSAGIAAQEILERFDQREVGEHRISARTFGRQPKVIGTSSTPLPATRITELVSLTRI